MKDILDKLEGRREQARLGAPRFEFVEDVLHRPALTHVPPRGIAQAAPPLTRTALAVKSASARRFTALP